MPMLLDLVSFRWHDRWPSSSSFTTTGMFFLINNIKLILVILLVLSRQTCIINGTRTHSFDDSIFNDRSSSSSSSSNISTLFREILEKDINDNENLIKDDQGTIFSRYNQHSNHHHHHHHQQHHNHQFNRQKNIDSIEPPTTTTSTTTEASVKSPDPEDDNLLDSQLFRHREWNFTEINLANRHLFYIRTKYSCSQPRAKLVKVLDYHPSPSKQYVPRCTVVHRCDDESGCCEDVLHRCEPSKTQLVDLYFHVIRSDMKNNITGGSAVGIERLTFLNHTQCECKPINYMPRTGGGHSGRPKPRAAGHSHKTLTSAAAAAAIEPHHKCKHVIKCPEPFVRRFRGSDQRCVCDCITGPGDRNLNGEKEWFRRCIRIQNGSAKLDPFWVRCIANDGCSEPQCSFGLHYNQTESGCSASLTALPATALQHRFNHQQPPLVRHPIRHHRGLHGHHHHHHHPVW